MVSYETLLNDPDCTIFFTLHTDASNKQLGDDIIQNNKPLELSSRILSKSQHNDTTTEKELLLIVECLKELRGIIFVYEINICSDHKNLVYAATLREYKRVMCC